MKGSSNSFLRSKNVKYAAILCLFYLKNDQKTIKED